MSRTPVFHAIPSVRSILVIALSMQLLAGCRDATDATNSTPSSAQPPVTAVASDSGTTPAPVQETDTASSMAPSETPTTTFKTIEWTDLMPKDDLEALLNPPEYINDIEDGSIEDQLSSQILNAIEEANDDPYQQALTSTRVVQEMDGQGIRLPGFIVPLEFDGNQVITRFFLVPFFGACIHVPPPPPNQIILVDAPQGFVLDALYDPFWISGVVSTSLTEHDIATSSYTMIMESFEPYSDQSAIQYQ